MTAMVTFRMFAGARAAAGAGEIEVPDAPLADALTALRSATPPPFADVLAICSLMADGVRLDPANPHPLPDGMVVDVLPPFAGG